MQTDPIADLLTRIRNGLMASAPFIDVPMSKIKVEIVKILEAEGFIGSHEVLTETDFPQIRIQLKYDVKHAPIIRSLRRVSKPGLRVYRKTTDLKPVRSGLATQILTTSVGLMTDREARRRSIGGEVLCEVW
ncbi:MAG: 30S ribosomal protein S8 [Armatimonadetes bacterium]|nr:30S ribosomal protein S8 [Armatimonadota bacterium]